MDGCRKLLLAGHVALLLDPTTASPVITLAKIRDASMTRGTEAGIANNDLVDAVPAWR